MVLLVEQADLMLLGYIQQNNTTNQLELCLDNSPYFETFEQYRFNFQNYLVRILGRIDNFDELKNTLSLHTLISQQDVLVSAFKKWQLNLAKKLVGDFYLIVWQKNKCQCDIMTSVSSLTSLFYYVKDQNLIFSNHFPSLKKQINRSLILRPKKITELLLRDFDHPYETYYEHIHRLPAAHQLTWHRQKTTVKQYWHPSSNMPLNDYSAEECYTLVQEAFSNAIRCRLPRKAKHLGAHLSGGLDSSAVSAMTACQHHKHQFTCFSSVPPNRFSFPHLDTYSLDDRHLSQMLTNQHDNISLQFIEEHSSYNLSNTTRFIHDHADGPTVNPFNFSWFYRTLDLCKKNNIALLLTGAMGNVTLSWSGLKTKPWHRPNRFLDYHLARIAQWSETDSPWWAEHTLLKTSALKQANLIALKPHQHTYRYANDPAWYVQDYLNAAAETIGLTNAMRFNTGVLDIDPTADQRLIELCLRIPQRHFRKGILSRTMVRLGLAAYLPPAIRFNQTRGLQCTTWFYQLKATLPYYWQHFEQYRQCDTIQQLLDLTSLETLLHQAATIDPFDFDPDTLYQQFFNKLGRSLHVCDWLYHFERQ